MKIVENSLDFLLNKRLERQFNVPNCSIIIGQKRAGKSTLSAYICQHFHKLGYKVLSNYPIENALALPMIPTFDKKTKKVVYKLDKNFLYDADLSHCVILIDEGANYWPARGYATDWTSRDTEFFTMMSHHDIIMFINVQYFDLIDLNVKRACDEIFFLTRSRYFKNLSSVAVSELVSLPVANLSAKIMTKRSLGAYPVHYELCEIPIGDFRFYRKPYYKYFSTEFDYKVYDSSLSVEDLEPWNMQPILYSASAP